MPGVAGSSGRLLVALVAAGVPAIGVAILDANNNVRIDTQGDVPLTSQQQAQANAVIAGFDFSDAANVAFQQAQEPLLQTLRQQAAQAIQDINTFLAIATPTNAQAIAEIQAIDRRQKAIIQAIGRLIVLVQGL